MIASRVDEYGKGAWIALTVLGFITWWPAGLALLIFLAVSGRLRCWRQERMGRWYYNAPGGAQGGPPGGAPGGSSGGNGGPFGGCGGFGPWGRRNRGAFTPSGNRAFDEYRAETLRRLEEEQKEFVDYLERLRQAKDKQEFDQFMAERRNRPGSTPEVIPPNAA